MFSYYNPQYCPSTSEESPPPSQLGQPPAAVQAERVRVSRSTALLRKCGTRVKKKKVLIFLMRWPLSATFFHSAVNPFSVHRFSELFFVLSPIPQSTFSVHQMKISTASDSSSSRPLKGFSCSFFCAVFSKGGREGGQKGGGGVSTYISASRPKQRKTSQIHLDYQCLKVNRDFPLSNRPLRQMCSVNKSTIFPNCAHSTWPTFGAMAYADVISLAGQAAAWLINMSVHAQALFFILLFSWQTAVSVRRLCSCERYLAHHLIYDLS